MLTIHGIPLSVHTRKAIIVAREKQLVFQVEPVIPFQPPADWAELSPTGKIPVLTHDDFVLPDSSAICAYLERLHPQRSVYPLDARAYAQALFFEEYMDSVVFPELVRPLFHQKVIRPRLLGQTTDAAAIEQVLQEVLPKVFGFLERETARGHLAGDAFTIADIALMSNLLNFHYLDLQIDARYRRLQEYFRRHLVRTSVQEALAGELLPARSMGLAVDMLAA
jgi:glutathione S-transferase